MPASTSLSDVDRLARILAEEFGEDPDLQHESYLSLTLTGAELPHQTKEAIGSPKVTMPRWRFWRRIAEEYLVVDRALARFHAERDAQ